MKVGPTHAARCGQRLLSTVSLPSAALTKGNGAAKSAMLKVLPTKSRCFQAVFLSN